jgi:hypothetical protein
MPEGLARVCNVLGPLVMCLVGCIYIFMMLQYAEAPVDISNDSISSVLSLGMSALVCCVVSLYDMSICIYVIRPPPCAAGLSVLIVEYEGMLGVF